MRRGHASAPQRVTRGHLREFAPSDAVTMDEVPGIEAKYRLLRNEWLTCSSRLRQAQELLQQAKDAGAHASVIDEAQKRVALVSAELGTWRRLAWLCRQRAEAAGF